MMVRNVSKSPPDDTKYGNNPLSLRVKIRQKRGLWSMHYDWELLARDVYRCRLPFLDVTVGLVRGHDQILLIDSGTTLFEARAVAEDVRELTGGAVSRILLTHHHFDHILGAAGFPAARVYAAAAVAEALTARIDKVRADAAEYGADEGELDLAVAGARAPDHQVLRVDIDLGGRAVHVEHPGRGHTDHDLIAVVPSTVPAEPTVVFCGDLVEESGDPAIDAESDLGEWPATLDRVLALGGPGAIYVPGHGATVDAAFVRRQRDWLARLTTRY